MARCGARAMSEVWRGIVPRRKPGLDSRDCPALGKVQESYRKVTGKLQENYRKVTGRFDSERFAETESLED